VNTLQNTRRDLIIIIEMGAKNRKNFGKKRETAKVKRAKRRDKAIKALNLIGIHDTSSPFKSTTATTNTNSNDDNNTLAMDDEEEELVTAATAQTKNGPDCRLTAKKELRIQKIQRKKELSKALKILNLKRSREQKKTKERKKMTKDVQAMKRERKRVMEKKKDNTEGCDDGVEKTAIVADEEMKDD
jgi:hypothetical protein